MKRVPAVWVAGVAVAGGLLVSALVSGASAQDRRVKIINETSYVITHFFGSSAGEESWQEDMLGQDALEPGQSAVIDFGGNSGDCALDFKVAFQDGAEVVREGIDVCKTTVYRLAD